MTPNEKAVLEAVHQWFPGSKDMGWLRPGAVAEPPANEAGSVPNTAPETTQEALW